MTPTEVALLRSSFEKVKLLFKGEITGQGQLAAAWAIAYSKLPSFKMSEAYGPRAAAE